MANRRQKKKKNTQAARQAAAAYKGKNAVAKPTVQKKPEPPKAEPKPETKPKVKQETAKKPVVQQKPPKQEKPKKAEPSKKQQPKKTAKNQKSFKTVKADVKKKIASLDPKKTSTVIFVASVIIAVVCVTALLMSLRFTVPKEAKIDYMGRNISDMYTSLVTDDLATQYEFTDRMERKGDTKKFRYYAADSIVFPEKYSTAMLNLVNVFDNNCVFIASIVDEGGTVVYQSLGLPAGRCLSDITISDLPYGTQEMKLVIAAYDPESYKLIGVQYSDLTVQVGIEKEVTDEETQTREQS